MPGDRVALGEFLECYPGFEFYIDEYAASLQVAADSAARRREFCRAMSVGAEPGGGWNGLKDAFSAITRGVQAYAGIGWSRPDYFRDIPLIDKNTLRARGPEYLSPFGDRRTWLPRETSGTTGPPVPIWYAPQFGFDFHLFAEWKVAWLCGALSEDAISRDVFGVALVDKKTVADRVWLPADGSRGLTLRYVYDERKPGAAEELVERLRTHSPALLVLKPNILASIIGALQAPLAPARLPLRSIICGGADLDGGVRQRAEAVFGVPVVNAYGMTEFGLVASECEARQGLHVYTHEVVVEVLNSRQELSEVGQGELVLSSVANPAMPLLRFKTGDLGEVVSEPCACGRTGPRILKLSGRMVKNFRFRDGTEFAPTSFNDLFKHFPIREFQVTQSAFDQIEVQVEFPSGGTAEQLAGIRAYVEKETRGLARAAVTEATFGSDSKFQRYRTLI